jgi:hypothetical protein
VMVTHETDPHETETLLGMCRPKAPANAGLRIFSDLAPNEAALLPGPEESQGQVRRFQLAPRLTAHVRHQAKYLDMPVVDRQAFVFSGDGRSGPRARTLKEFMGLLAVLPPGPLLAHLERHDFSRWLGDVFRDNPLAARVRALEKRTDTDDVKVLAADIAQSIRARYEIAAERSPSPGGAL